MAGSTRVLYLLRHAKSSWDDPARADFDRPLAPRGRKAAARMSAFIERCGIRPQLILCSTATRARQTCEALPAAEVVFEDGLYGASAVDLLQRLHELPSQLEQVIVVGHNPGMQDLAVSLAGEGEPSTLEALQDHFPTAALAALSFGSAWADLGPGRTRLEWFVTPRGLPDHP